MPCSLLGSETKAGIPGRMEMRRGHSQDMGNRPADPLPSQLGGRVQEMLVIPEDADVPGARWAGTW